MPLKALPYGTISADQAGALLSPDPAEPHWIGRIRGKPGHFWTPAALRPDVVLTPDGFGVGKKAVAALPMVWAESDTGTLDEQLARVSAAVAAGMPEPTVAALSGDPRPDGADPGKSVHLFWRVSDPWPVDAPEWRRVMAAIAHAIDGDLAVIDPARRMRVPGVQDGARYQTVARVGPSAARADLEAWAQAQTLPPRFEAKARWRKPSRIYIDLAEVAPTLAELAADLDGDDDKRQVVCPFHDDATPSAFLSRTPAERAFLYCSTCDTTWVDQPTTTLQLDRSPKGAPLKTLTNVARILRRDTAHAGRVRYNERTLAIDLDGAPLATVDVHRLRETINDAHGFEPTAADVADAIAVVARERAYNPLLIELRATAWDGTPRLDRWLVDCGGGVADTPLHRAYGRKFMLSAIARALYPGCKVDTVLLVIGAPRLFKSSLFRALFGDRWFGDSDLDLNSKDSALVLARSWCHEIAELSSFSRADAARIKSFLSRQIDMFRAPYDRAVSDTPRHTVVVATSNEGIPLRDKTGNRRFWAVEVDAPIDLDRIRRDRAQLWAEALVAVEAGETWWLDGELADAADESNEKHLVDDTLEAAVLAWLSTTDKRSVRVLDVVVGALRVPVADAGRYSRAVGEVLRAAGWVHTRTSKSRFWVAPK